MLLDSALLLRLPQKNSGYGSLGVRYFLIPLNITLCFELNWIIIFECWLCFPATKFHSMSAHRFVPKSIHFWGPYFPLKTNGIVVFPIKEQQCLFTIIVSSSEHQLWLYGECALAHIFRGFSLRSVPTQPGHLLNSDGIAQRRAIFELKRRKHIAWF